MMMTMMVVVTESSHDLSLSQICVQAQYLYIYLLFIHLWLIS